MKKNYYISGEWNVICDVCSKKIKSHEARQRWDGFIVCKEDFEHRHPQDFVKAQTDKITVPFTRPQPPYVFVGELSLNQNDTASATDYLLIGDAVEALYNEDVSLTEDFVIGYVRELFLDDSTSAVTDSLTSTLTFGLLFNDSTTSSDSFSKISDYVRTLTETLNASDTLDIQRPSTLLLQENTTAANAGTLVHQNYVDSTYLAEDYVSTTYTF